MGSLVLFVKKKDETLRLFIGYTELNKITRKKKSFAPNRWSIWSTARSRSLSKIDVRSRYHRLMIKPDDISKTTFRTSYGHYEFIVMPFGQINAPVAIIDE